MNWEKIHTMYWDFYLSLLLLETIMIFVMIEWFGLKWTVKII